MTGKRRFGRVRQLPSGRWQARYKGPDGIDRPAPTTFATKRAAEVWLTKIEVDVLADQWLNPDAGAVPFGEYARSWIEERPGLRPKTIQLYRYLLRRHLLPTFTAWPVCDIREPHVRRWRKQLLDGGTSPVTVAKAYRLLKAIMNTAADDGLITRNPCRIKGAGQERSPERPVLTVAQVFTLADAINPRYRALVLLAVFAGLRWGELAALRRRDIDLDVQVVRVVRQLTEVRGNGLAFGPPKSDAGKRAVVLPTVIIPDLAWHLARFTASQDDALLFTGPTGVPLWHSSFRHRYWLPALAKAGLAGIHIHDLRHTGNHLAATSGATLRELMDRMGHSSSRAALIYLHGSDERQQKIADAISEQARKHMPRGHERATEEPVQEKHRACNGHGSQG
jgi:integrase